MCYNFDKKKRLGLKLKKNTPRTKIQSVTIAKTMSISTHKKGEKLKKMETNMEKHCTN